MNDPELFVVRIWHRLASGFRASARRVDEEETRHFAKPDELTSFLADAGRPDADPDKTTQRNVPDRTPR